MRKSNNLYSPTLQAGTLRMRSKLISVMAASALALTAACASPEERVERYSQEGMEYLAEGELGKANVQFQNALKLNEEHVPSLVGMASIVEEKQDFQSMFGLLQRIVRLDPTQVESQVKLGKLYLIGSDETSALEHAEAALALDEENIGAQTLKAAVLLKVGDNAGAVELARGVIDRDPSNAEAVTVLATERVRAGDNEAALVELDAGLSVDPEIAVLQLLRIQVLTNLGRTDDVTEAYSELIELFPDQAAYRRVFASDLLNRDRFEEAQQQLEAIAELESDNDDAKLDVIRVINSNQALGPDAAGEKFRAYLAAEPANFDLKFAYVDFLRSIDAEDDANDLLETLEQSNDDGVALRAKNEIAESLFASGDVETAKALVEEILTRDERNTDALIKQASLKIEASEFDSAIIDLRTALDNSPNLPEALVVMAAAFEKQGSISSASAELANAYEASNRAPNITRLFAAFLVRQKDLARAEEVLVQSLATFPGNVDNLKLLARVRLSMQDWRGAEEIAQVLESIGDNNSDVDQIRSDAYSGLGEYERVIETLSSRGGDAPLASRPLASLISAYVQTNRIDDAKGLLDRIVASNENDNYPARILLAQLHGLQNDEESAIAVLNDAVAHDGSRPEAYELLYRYYIQNGQSETATNLIDEGLAKSPDNVALRVFKADILLGQRRFLEALELYSALIDERPNDPLIANNFVSLSSDFRLDQASISRALELVEALKRQNNAAFNDTIGWAHYRAGDFDTAVQYLSRAAESANGNAEIHYHLGAAYLAVGNNARGIENLEAALSAGGSEFRFENEVRALLAQP